MTGAELTRRYLSWRFTQSTWARLTKEQKQEWISWAKGQARVTP